jgi:DMSO/TMAO reductase YedYZ molybdopterin-dependent catalytic subunit
MLTRRHLLATGAALAGSGIAGSGVVTAAAQTAPPLARLPAALPEGLRGEAVLDALPGKRPLIKLTWRPPNYETPLDHLRTAITPNDAFFVRYHLADIPQVDASAWRLTIGGDGASGGVELDLAAIKALPAVEVTAVCQCAGNRRGLFQPHVAGIQWGYGGMGCARFKGARLKDVLDRAGVQKEAVEVVLDGADGPVVDKTPDFVKSLPLWKAMEDTTLIAYEMNGEPLPHWNGFPARVVVPGWTATYWVKHLTSIRLVTRPFDGFWMKSAYRVPLGRFPLVERFLSQETAVNTPITEMVVNSLITSHADGAVAKVGNTVTVGGIAWDAGHGIASVEVSADGGKSWSAATLGEDLGRFAFRPWTFTLAPREPGRYLIMARAANRLGQGQTTELIANPAGYHHNVMHAVTLTAA